MTRNIGLSEGIIHTLLQISLDIIIERESIQKLGLTHVLKVTLCSIFVNPNLCFSSWCEIISFPMSA